MIRHDTLTTALCDRPDLRLGLISGEDVSIAWTRRRPMKTRETPSTAGGVGCSCPAPPAWRHACVRSGGLKSQKGGRMMPGRSGNSGGNSGGGG
jgi:hypothetical protein